MNKLLLILLSFALVSCGKDAEMIDYNYAIFISDRLTENDVYSYRADSLVYFNLDCANSFDKNSCLDHSLEFLKKNYHDICVIDESISLDQEHEMQCNKLVRF